jgi:serine/threonine-protein kinase
VAESAQNLQGRLLGGRYRVEQLLGVGGMGAVYAGVQEDLQRRVAIKVLHGELSADDVLRFRHEALAAAALGHPNIVQVTDFQTPPGEPPFLVMEALEGTSLRALMERHGKLPAQRTVFIAVQILAALAAAHKAQIIHRDIKPANVFLSSTPASDDFVKLLDFGIAKVLREGAQSPETVRGAILGTPAYMAPEQALDMDVDPRADLYAVGACMYEMISGRRPLLGTTSAELLVAIARQVPPKLDTFVPDVDARLSDLVDRALSKDPERRPRSANEMIEALSPWAFSAVNRAKGRPGERAAEPTTVVGASAVDTAGTTASLAVPGSGPATLRDATLPIPVAQPQNRSAPPFHSPSPHALPHAAPSNNPPPLALSPAPRPAFTRERAGAGGASRVNVILVLVGLAVAALAVAAAVWLKTR